MEISVLRISPGTGTIVIDCAVEQSAEGKLNDLNVFNEKERGREG